MKQNRAIFLGLLTALAAAAASSILIPLLFLKLVGLWVQTRNPGDPSAGDSAGWMIVFAGPLLLGIDFVASVYVGFLAYRLSYGRFLRP